MRRSEVRVIDASSAHRTASGWVYGLPELAAGQPERIAHAHRVSNSGCYPTGAVMLLRPLIDAGLLPADYPLTIHAVSGYSRRGRAGLEDHEGAGAASAAPFQVYGLGLHHKHVPEIQQHAGLKQAPVFVPAYGNYRQGIVVTIALHLRLLTTPTGWKLGGWLLTHYVTVVGKNFTLDRLHALAAPADLHRMQRPEHRDPFDFPREPLTAWERRLRPRRASGWRLSTLLVMGVLVVAWVAIKPANPREALKKFKVTNVAPATELTEPSLGLAPVLKPQPNPQVPGITKCLGPQGVLEYTDGACRAGLRPVRADLPAVNVADGMTPHQRLASQQANQVEAQRVLAQEIQVVQSVGRTSDECSTLDAAVAAYDAEARQPLPAWRQDRLRELRKAARDRQFSLRCQ